MALSRAMARMDGGFMSSLKVEGEFLQVRCPACGHEYTLAPSTVDTDCDLSKIYCQFPWCNARIFNDSELVYSSQ